MRRTSRGCNRHLPGTSGKLYIKYIKWSQRIFRGSAAGAARKEGNMDNKAYQKMDYALCLLSAAADGRNHGCIVNSFHR